MGKPAARIGDMHVCPMIIPSVPPVPHVGGPILAGAPNVMIGGQPAARVSDQAICTGCGIPDPIAMGSPTVMIGGLMAARMGDSTMHGGVIVMGFPMVLIGEAGSPPGMGPVTSALAKMLGLALAALAALSSEVIAAAEAAQDAARRAATQSPAETINGVAQALKDAIDDAVAARDARREARNERIGNKVKAVVDGVVSTLDPDGTKGLSGLGDDVKDAVDQAIEEMRNRRRSDTDTVVKGLKRAIDTAAEAATPAGSAPPPANPAGQAAAMQDAAREGQPHVPFGP